MAVDGKVLRGCRVPGRKAVWLLAAMDHAGTVLGQRQIADKSNETPSFISPRPSHTTPELDQALWPRPILAGVESQDQSTYEKRSAPPSSR